MGDDTIVGNDAGNVLIGGAGRDTMTGQSNRDSFVFNAKICKANADYITDFLNNTDIMVLDHNVFKKLPIGNLKKKAFFSDKDVKAQDKNDRILFDTKTGECFYDKDGKGGVKAKIFATVVNHHDDLSASDFLIVL